MKLPLVSVVITSYNRPNFLEKSIQSVLCQTFSDYELIVVDDCSPTDLRSVINKFPGSIRYHRKNVNAHVSDSRNVGVKLARGRYIAFLDDDDVWLPEHLQLHVNTIEGRNASLSGFTIMESGRTYVHDIQEITPDMLRYGNKLCGTTGFMVLREVALRYPFDTSLKWGEDWDVYIQCALEQPIRYTSKATFLRRTEAGDSLTNATKKLSEEDVRRFMVVLDKHRGWLGEKIYWRRVAGVHLTYISERPHKSWIILTTIRRAGLKPTLWWLRYKLLKGNVNITFPD